MPYSEWSSGSGWSVLLNMEYYVVSGGCFKNCWVIVGYMPYFEWNSGLVLLIPPWSIMHCLVVILIIVRLYAIL